eukprot:TRINITY_DN2138_c0_g1_i7.p1 TRINITY_DN2138_c0_g1~~TRINITY_DN2138_c0_g1_i7.p1  ORF type:complete len:458 (-),score=113.19 TRINITY_DN2138_c0_g1_i7:380-1753(-)
MESDGDFWWKCSAKEFHGFDISKLAQCTLLIPKSNQKKKMEVTQEAYYNRLYGPNALHGSRMYERAAVVPLAAKNGALADLEAAVLLWGTRFINARDETGSTALHWAVRRGDKSMFDYLVKKPGIDFAAGDQYGWTVLHVAVRYEQDEILRELLEEHHVDIELKTWGGDDIFSKLAGWRKHGKINEKCEKILFSWKSKLDSIVADGANSGVDGLCALLDHKNPYVRKYVCVELQKKINQHPLPLSQQIIEKLSETVCGAPECVLSVLTELAKTNSLSLPTHTLRWILGQLRHKSVFVRRESCRIVAHLSHSHSLREQIRREGGLQPIILLSRYDADNKTAPYTDVALQALKNLGEIGTPPDISSWNLRDVGIFLSSIGCSPELIDEVEQNEIDGTVLVQLSNDLISHFTTFVSTKQRLRIFESVRELRFQMKEWAGYDIFFFLSPKRRKRTHSFVSG